MRGLCHASAVALPRLDDVCDLSVPGEEDPGAALDVFYRRVETVIDFAVVERDRRQALFPQPGEF